MVEICRWPKASSSVSSIVCIETPSRIACVAVDIDSYGAAIVLLVAADIAEAAAGVCSLATSFGTTPSVAAASVSVSVYWYCVRLMPVPIWMSCTGCEVDREAGDARRRLPAAAR